MRRGFSHDLADMLLADIKRQLPRWRSSGNRCTTATARPRSTTDGAVMSGTTYPSAPPGWTPVESKSIGPFTTHVTFQREDGSTVTWSSRSHRTHLCFLGSAAAASAFTRQPSTRRGGSGSCLLLARCAFWWRRCRGSSTLSVPGLMRSFFRRLAALHVRCGAAMAGDDQRRSWPGQPSRPAEDRDARAAADRLVEQRCPARRNGVFNVTTTWGIQTSLESTSYDQLVAAGCAGLDLLRSDTPPTSRSPGGCGLDRSGRSNPGSSR